MRRLYLIDGCPFAHRAAIALAEKGLPFTPVPFEKEHRPPELEAAGPRAKSPTLFDDDTVVHDSAVVLEYLEDRYPERALLPPDPAGRAEVRMRITQITEELGPKFGAVVGAVFAHDAERTETAKQALTEALPSWDRHLADRIWVTGEAFSLADIVLYTQFPSVRALSGFEVGPELPQLQRWLERVAVRPSAPFPR